MADSPHEVRAKLRAKLLDEGRLDLAAILTKCAEEVPLQCVCCKSRMVVERGCARRWCPVCAPRITAARLHRLSRIAPRIQWPLFVTLTKRNTRDGADCIRHLKDQFRAFRRTDFWADRVKGGVVSFEVTHRGRGWHPHLHALVDCRWLAVATPEPTRWMTKRQQASLCKRAQYELSQVWAGYIGQDKAQVWAQRAYGTALKEVLKYSIKPADLLHAGCEAGEMIDVIDGGRMMGTFGNCHACSKEFVGIEEEVMADRPCRDCQSVKSITTEDALRRMMNEPRKLKEHWRQHLETRYRRDGMVEGSEEWRQTLDIEDDWWNDDE